MKRLLITSMVILITSMLWQYLDKPDVPPLAESPIYEQDVISTNKAEALSTALNDQSKPNNPAISSSSPLNVMHADAESHSSTLLDDIFKIVKNDLFQKYDDMLRLNYENSFRKVNGEVVDTSDQPKFDWDEFNQLRKGRFIYPSDEDYLSLLQFLEGGNYNCKARTSQLGVQKACHKNRWGIELFAVYKLHGYDTLYMDDVMWRALSDSSGITETFNVMWDWADKYAVPSFMNNITINSHEARVIETLDLNPVRKSILNRFAIKCDNGLCTIVVQHHILNDSFVDFYNMYPNCFDIIFEFGPPPMIYQLVCFDTDAITW
ncbi:hypothetical protein [Psychrosphaera algicola]|uniref:Uncharacterized protein n=1 Tax=Psychrosphaera algicola TaxID=3023714 RepID=A0ABT5FAK8_9GAMM|nr:hypothetical protein [Psychrosphaera sp. G1-22]MDC2887616.1 hypothetical protein [Psychrosphaera sp. G1-22]